jgi:phage shock protein E
MVEIRKLTMAIFLLVISVSLVACDTAQGDGSGTSGDGAAIGTVVKTEKGQYTNISPEELKAMLEKKDFFLVDVHVPNEGKMPDLDARIPYDQIAQELDQLPQDKGEKIVLTCMSDSMSTMASATLADMGYTNVFNLAGGFNAWRAKGYPFTPEP